MKRMRFWLTIILTFLFLPLSILTFSADSNRNTILSDKKDAPIRLRELAEKRDLYSKHFLNSDGTVTAEIYNAPIHYKNKKGEYEDIDLNIISSEDSVFSKTSEKNNFKVKFKEKDKDKSVASTVYGVTSAVYGVASTVYIEADNPNNETKWISYKMIGADTSRSVCENNKLRYQGVFKDTDLEYVVTPIGLKENIIINKPTESLNYTFIVETSNGIRLEQQSAGGIYAIDNDSGKVMWEIIAPFAQDSNKLETYNVKCKLNKQVISDLEYDVVTISLDDSDFLKEAVYPIFIDPTTITYSAVISAHVGTQQNGETAPYPPSTEPFLQIGNGIAVVKQREWISCYYANKLWLGLIKFDTSSIPDNAIVTSANLNLRGILIGNANNLSLIGEWNSLNPLDTSLYTTSQIENTAFLNPFPLANISSSVYNSFALKNLSNINKTGTSGFRLSLTSGTLTGYNGISFYGYEVENYNYLPLLQITYGYPASIPTNIYVDSRVNANHTITWAPSTDDETSQSNISYNIQLSTDNGVNWHDIVSLTSNGATSYNYNFASEPEAQQAKIRIRAYDGTGYGDWGYTSTNFIINHNIAPSITINSPTQNQVFSEVDTAFVPQISVTDVNNNTLTCQYFVDSEVNPRDTKITSNTSSAKTINFYPLDMNNLAEGYHILVFRANDGTDITSASINIKVDKSAPALGSVTVVSSSSTITISGSAVDNIAGLAQYPYRYTIGTTTSAWTTDTSFALGSLSPNIYYVTKFEAMDSKGHITLYEGGIYTKAEVPALQISNATPYTLDIGIVDNNPTTTTQYQIISGSNYVTASGNLTTVPTWIPLPSKSIKAVGLLSNTNYIFQAKALNQAGAETVLSSSANGTTTNPPPGVPQNIRSVDITPYAIIIAWNAVNGATGYDVKIDKDGVETIINNVITTSFEQTGLVVDTQYKYCVRSRNSVGTSDWSGQLVLRTEIPTYTVSCLTDKIFDISIRTSNVQNFSSKTFTITYNPNDIDVIDLCSFTEQTNLTTGTISNTGISVSQFTPGTIAFTIDKIIPQNKNWTGAVNSIRFKSKINGQSTISYCIK